MSKQLISIGDFKRGIVNDETSQSNTGFVNMFGLDPWSEDGVLQINKRLLSDTATGLTNVPLSFTTFDNKIISGTEDEELWVQNTSNIWTLLHTNVNNGDNNDLITYQDFLIFASIDEIGISVNTTIAGGFNDNPVFAGDTNAFLNGVSSGEHFMKEFNNRLYISDGNFIVELDGASDPTTPANWVLTLNKFILPVNENIASLEVVGSELAIGTLSGNLYFWDGASANASQILKTTLGGIHGLIQLENTLFAFAGEYGVVYRYNGADLLPEIQIPNFNIFSTSHVRKPSVRKFKNGMIFGIRSNGIYVYNRNSSTEPFSLTRYGATAGGDDNDVMSIFINTITTAYDDFIIGVRSPVGFQQTDGTDRYRMEEAGAGDTSAAPHIETFVYELRDNNGKPNKIQGIQGLFKGDGQAFVRNNIQIEYRLNRDQPYTVLGSIGEDGIDFDKILRGIGKRVSTVQFRVKFGRESNVITGRQNTKLTGLKIF